MDNNFHLTLNALLHYVVKCEYSKLPLNFHYNITIDQSVLWHARHVLSTKNCSFAWADLDRGPPSNTWFL